MDICGSVSEPVPSETELDVSYVQGKSRICKIIQEKIKAARDLVGMYPPRIKVVGLYGGGGVGKTTFCKAMCNEMRTEFNGRVFHVELKGENELKLFQSPPTKLSGARNEDVQKLGMYECELELQKYLGKHKFFLAIDNVTDSARVIAQADALLKMCSTAGSVALVTARSLDQLERMKTNIREIDCIEMPELEENEARSLLLYHAAPSNPVNEDILGQCLQRCYFRKGDDDDDVFHFLPAALEMFGLQLGNDCDQWMTKLEKLDTSNQQREEEHTIFSILRMSFDTLSNEDQVLFMDAALFYPRNYSDSGAGLRVCTLSTLDWLHMVHGGSIENIKRRLKGLKEKMLLCSFDERGTEIGVHDLWREFASMEANGGKQESSLWFYDNDEDNRIYRHRGESGVRGWGNLQRAFIWRSLKSKDELNFSLCSNLTMLTLRNVVLVNKQLDLSPLKCLKYLEVHLNAGPHPNIRVLGLGSLGRLVVLRWFCMLATSPCLQEIGLLTNLQVLQLHFVLRKKTDLTTLNFQQMDFSKLSLLRTFSLWTVGLVDGSRYHGRSFGRNVPRTRDDFEDWRNHGAEYARFQVHDVCMHESFQKLQELDVSHCGSIKALPGVDELMDLLELKASGCICLEEFPNIKKLQRLRKLDISHCFSIRALPGLDELVALVELDAFGCCDLAKFPNLQKLQRLQRLDISVCSSIKAVPGLDELVALVELHADGCSSLEELPNLTKLRRLQILDITNCPLIKGLPGLDNLAALQVLRAKNCLNLAELPDMRKLTNLRVLNLKIPQYDEEYRFKYLEYIPADDEEPSLAFIKPASIKVVPSLDKLIALSKLTVDFVVFEHVPDLGKLTNLTRLSLRGWSSQAAAGLATLPNLQVLEISYTDGLQLVEPTGISSLTSLKRLNFYKCDFKDVSCLSSLTAFQHLQVKHHRNCADGLELKKLLLSVLELPSLRFTVDVYHNPCWSHDETLDVDVEMQRLRERSLVVHRCPL